MGQSPRRESVEQIITAFVRIEDSKQGLDFRAQILAATLNAIVEVCPAEPMCFVSK